MKNATARTIVTRIVNARIKLPLYSWNFLVIWYFFTQILIFVNRSIPTQTNVMRNTKIKFLKIAFRVARYALRERLVIINCWPFSSPRCSKEHASMKKNDRE
jgi:hypothetical protein